MCWIYFVQAVQGGNIKIGKSINPLDRIKTLQASSPVLLKPLRITMGTSAVERYLHELFAEDRVYGEWFRPTPRLLQKMWEYQPMLHYYQEDYTPGLNANIIT